MNFQIDWNSLGDKMDLICLPNERRYRMVATLKEVSSVVVDAPRRDKLLTTTTT
jgi:glycerol-3-phosphate cytidylyltransferase-like family protein